MDILFSVRDQARREGVVTSRKGSVSARNANSARRFSFTSEDDRVDMMAMVRSQSL